MEKSRNEILSDDQMMAEEEKNDLVFLLDLLWIIVNKLYAERGRWTT